MVSDTHHKESALRDENSRLRARLEEYEQLLSSIRSGEVDAIILNSRDGHQIAPLQQSDNIYRHLVEQMGEGAMVVSEQGHVLYANHSLASLLKLPLKSVIGSYIERWVAKDNIAHFRDLWLQLTRSEPPTKIRDEFMLIQDGHAIPVYLSLSRGKDKADTGNIHIVVTDLRLQKRNETLAADERLARAILEQSSDAIIVCDQHGQVIRSNSSARKLCNRIPEGASFEQHFPLWNDTRQKFTLSELLQRPQGENFPAILNDDSDPHHVLVSYELLHGPTREALGSVIRITDISRIQEAEQQANLAREELSRQLELAKRGRLALLSVVEDIKQTEHALRESEAHFRLALGNLPISVWNMDDTLRYIWVYDNEFGIAPETLLGKDDTVLFTAEDAHHLSTLKRQVLHSGEKLNQQVTVLIDDQHQHYDLYIEPLRHPNGNVIGITGAMINISATRELEQARRKLSDALRQSASPMVMLDLEQNFEFTNEAFNELFGFEPGEIVGKPATLLAAPGDNNTLSPVQIESASRLHQTFRGEVLSKHKLGDLIPTYLTAAPLMDDDGNFSGFVGSYNDLRAIKASERRLQEALNGTITAISHTIEKRDPYTAGHQQRVAELAVAIAREMELDKKRVQGIYLGSLIHDIGKIHIPSEVLSRPGRLSENEFDLIKSHPDVGYEIIKDIKFDWPIAEMVYQHHERIDGSGYPNGLKGDEICLEAKIIAIADIVEAMTSHRPYRPGLGLERALAQITSEAGISLDREIVNHCLNVFSGGNFEWQSSFSA